ncbi:MAG TPA: serine hydrolase domain-containing protein [Gemmatimonadaceae bacterium]|jgi:CubicO group peptidase (beta-lactamase class C family)|nr:serine hydrolase domain-containing protein [Gemmatimonadaceae bacterium]
MKSFRFAVITFVAAAGCAAPPPARVVSAAPTPVKYIDPEVGLNNSGLDPALAGKLDKIVKTAIEEAVAPGVAIAVGRNGHIAYMKGYGYIDWNQPGSPVVDTNTLYDLASLTKVIATTTLAMILEETGQLDINRTVVSYLPEFNSPEKSQITVKQLLTHSGGLEAGANIFTTARGRDQYLYQINNRPLEYTPGTNMIYSDWDMILLQLVMERISGKTLDILASEKIFRPLGMIDTQYQPPISLRSRIAPTQVDDSRGGLLWGSVHDENAWAMGGVAGHAGLFSTARDLALFSMMILNGGEGVNGVRIVKPATIARWTARQGKESTRALGWDSPEGGSSAGQFFSPWSFGHTGFTGTSIWIDPEKDLFVVVLTNRVNPTRNNTRHVQLRRDVADAVQQSVLGARIVNWEAR